MSIAANIDTQILGIVNVTPDSFSDGGLAHAPEQAIALGLRLLEDGADILDIGGESTRPGAEPVSEDEELARIIPVIEGLRQQTDAPISVDTMKPGVARAAFAAGANVWNDVSALQFAPESLACAAQLPGQIILMHMLGTPSNMQDNPDYPRGVMNVVRDFFAMRIAACVLAGIGRERLILDPGIGFGKTPAHNVELLAQIDRLSEFGLPVLVGASRKRFIQALDPQAADPMDRLGGSLAVALHAAERGARYLRVHDVRQTRQALNVWAGLRAR